MRSRSLLSLILRLVARALDRDPTSGVFYAALECGVTDGFGTFDIITRTATFIGNSVDDLDGLVDPATSTAPTSGPASALTSTITGPTGGTLPDGVATAAITVELFDAALTALTVGEDHVTLASTLGSLSGVTDNGDGTYSATLTSTVVGTATVTGVVNGRTLTDDATVRFTTADATQSTITGSPTSIPADGVSTSTITVQVVDVSGTPIQVTKQRVRLVLVLY